MLLATPRQIEGTFHHTKYTEIHESDPEWEKKKALFIRKQNNNNKKPTLDFLSLSLDSRGKCCEVFKMTFISVLNKKMQRSEHNPSATVKSSSRVLLNMVLRGHVEFPTQLQT